MTAVILENSDAGCGRGEVLKVYPHLKLHVYVDGIRIHVWSKNNELAQAMPTVVGKRNVVIQKEKLKLFSTAGGKVLESNILSLCDAEGIGLTMLRALDLM